ncbi:MAG TPA: dockerin type I repeat-containing protein [Planctomycetota bacterium]|nr:dockerin type I repeat-containing protein [Planctomycetota bacterium]
MANPDTETIPGLFVRGDTNNDGKVNIADCVFLLNYLFTGGSKTACYEVGDVNDDKGQDISDAVYLLRYLFLGGADPLPPGPRSCGPDPTPDALGPCLDPSGACDL